MSLAARLTILTFIGVLMTPAVGLDQQRSGIVAPSGQFQRGHMPPNQFLQFSEMGVRRQHAVWVRVSGDQKRNPALCVSLKKQDGLFGGGSKQIASLKTQTERGTCHLRDEQFALGEPGHIARKYFLGRHAPVSLPSVVAYQVACEDFMPQRFENVRIFFAASIEERLPATVKPK